MKKVVLYFIAWAAVPILFGGYVHLAYSWNLERGSLPFLGAYELRWWIAFVVALLVGGACIIAAQRPSGMRGLLWSALYLVAMSIVLFSVHLGVACGHGDCL